MRRISSQLRNASSVAQAIAATRKGGIIGRALAWSAALSVLIDVALPQSDVDDSLRETGWKAVESSISPFLCRLLMSSEEPRTRVDIDGHNVTIWGGEVSAVYERGSYRSGPYVRAGGSHLLGSMIQKVVWSQGTDLMLMGSRMTDDGKPHDAPRIKGSPLSLVEMPECSPYFGSPGLDHYVKRIRRYDNERGAGGRGRCFLLRGPTGVGKGVLARNIAAAIGSGSRTLKIDNDVAGALSTRVITDVIRWLKPAILLIDDVSLTGWDNSDSLGPFEAMRQLDGYLFCTMMEKEGTSARRQRSSNEHLPGMRPGRVDEVWRLKRPDPIVRERLLRHYLGRTGLKVVGARLPTVVTATHGLTGAYIAEVALRLRVHGMRTWRTEVNAVKAQAPPFPAKRKPTTRRKVRKKAAAGQASEPLEPGEDGHKGGKSAGSANGERDDRAE